MEHIKDMKQYLEKITESDTLELKESKNSLPKEFWPTYSSFSNTNGGRIILGIKEHMPQNIITGVKSPDKVVQDLWNNLSNKQKVSFCAMNNSDINIVPFDENHSVIFVDVPEADLKNKPVHLNNQYEQSYIRKGEGDYRVTDAELRSMLRNSNPIDDTLCSEEITLESLDPISISSFKERVSARYPQNHFETLDPQSFLRRIGAIKIDANNKVLIKNGTLLFLGKYESIKEVYPSYFLDYINRSTEESRWIDRVSTDELNNTHMNIYNFFNIVFEKLRAIVIDKFELDESNTRIKNPNFDIAIREALTNCLAHADYVQGFPSVKIEARNGWFLFRNPGQLLVSIQQFINGGDSRPRNETIMSFFRYLGISERQGEGGPSIYRTAIENDYRLPEIKTNLESTELKIWHIDLIDSHPELNANERDIYVYLYKNQPMQKFADIQKTVGLTEYKTRKAIDSLAKKDLIIIAGQGKRTRYTIADRSRLLYQLKDMIDTMQNTL